MTTTPTTPTKTTPTKMTPTTTGLLTMGVDLGQRQDPTAMIVIESNRMPDGWNHRVVGAGRAPLGTPYGVVADQVKARAADLLSSGRQVNIVADATGVGIPVVDDLIRKGAPCPVTGIVFVTGFNPKIDPTKRECNVPKTDLVNVTVVAAEQGRLRISAGLDEREALIEELGVVESKLGPTGRERITHRDGTHDDMVMAMCCAVWFVEKSGLAIPPVCKVGFSSTARGETPKFKRP